MATNPYTSQSISGYNANPPPDDDTTGSGNQVEWQKHLDKIGDPNKNLSEGIDTAALSMGTKVINTDAGEANTLGGTIAYTTSELTISGGSITPTATNHTVDTEADAATDDLNTLATSSVNDRAVVMIRAENAARVVTAKNATGNINLQGNADAVLDVEVPLVLQRNGANWEEISRPTRTSTWTPVIAGSVTPGTQTYDMQIGRYTQKGNMVHAWFGILLSAFDAATNGNMTVIGLPLPAANTGIQYSGSIGQYSLIDLDVVGGYRQLILTLPGNTAAINIQETGDDVAVVNITEADFSATTLINGYVAYEV